MADQLLNNETREFMKSIGLRDAANETDKAKGSKKNKNDSNNNNKNNKTKPEEKKKKFTEVVSPPSTPVERPTPLPAKKKAISEKPKVKARKWGKGSKDVVDSQNSKDNKESKVGKDGKGFPNKSKHQNQSQNQNKDVMIIKGKPSTPELNWLHVKIDPNQQILSSFSDMKWYQVVASFDDVNFQDFKISKQSLETINSSVATLFAQEVAKYQKSKSLNGEEKWMNDVIRSGTLTDKIAALALRVQQSPPHELESLDLLISMALKKEQRTSQLALEALKDLLVHNLLPDRRLIPYALRPLGHSAMSLSVLLTFWYENELIKRIESIMNALEIGLKSTVDYFKMKCMEIVADWLSTKPEQENILLSFLVNKLGDPSSKVGSKCITLLSNVVYRHPAMKLVIIKEVRQLISRSNLIPRAVYSGVIFLSQIKLGVNENKVAVELVDCYVSLFEKAVTQDTLGSKLLAALLTGINRAFPFLVNKSSLNKHTDALFKIVHQSSFSSATQALTLISYLALGHQPEKSSKKGSTTTTTAATTKANSEKNKNNTTVNEEEGEKEGGDLIARYYNSLYSKLLADEILTRSHNTLFFNLLFRSMKRDPSDVRVLSFCKRILINTTHATPPIAAGLIFLVSEVCRSRPTLIEKLITTLESTPTESSQTDESYFLLGNFDGSKRNPSYACQQNSSNAWELVLFKSHFNPSVKTFAKSFMDPTAKHTITYSGDPTVDFSITSFLNRFAYKNPKKQQLEQRRKRSQVLSEEPVNTRAFLESASEVAPEKVFFYKFFGERNKLIAEGRSRRKKRRSDEDDDDDDDRSDLGSDFDEQEIDRFADKLADELMENYAGKADIDDDDDDDGAFDDDAFGEDEDDDGADDFDENQGDDDDEGEGEGDDDTPYLEGQGDGEDDDGDDGLHDFSEDFDEPPPSAVHKNKSSGGKDKNKKRKAASNDDVFAAAEDFEDDMEANVAGVLGLSSSRGGSSESTPPPASTSASKHANKSKKRSRKG